MNSKNQNLSIEQTAQLRQAVQQQLDLILKMEEDRKTLKKQNKLLTNKLKSLNVIAEKYYTQTSNVSVNTDEFESDTKNISQKLQKDDKQIQVEIQMPTVLNNSKLSEAHNLLKTLDEIQLTKIQQQKIQQENNRGFKKNNKKSVQTQQQKSSINSNNKQLSQQIVKMSKQLNSLKKQLKQSEHKSIKKDKQLKQLKKCLQNKGQALQKCRKQFNQLSNLYNADKYKSIKSLQAEIKTLKKKLSQKTSLQQKQFHQKYRDLKSMLADLTSQYQEYKQQNQKKIQIFIAELASKQKQNEQLLIQQRNLLKKLQYQAVLQ